MKRRGNQETFVIRILSRQNATWQGTIAWMEGRKQEAFRSELELIRLMDSTVAARERGQVQDDE